MLYLHFSDETNQQPSEDAKFFIYGGVFIPAEKLPELDALVAKARSDNGYLPGDEFKSDTRSRPKHVTMEQHIAAKNAVLEGCVDLGVRFAACLVLHAIAKNHPINQSIGWGINTMMTAFNRFLDEQDATGICVVDRMPFDIYKVLRTLFQSGISTNKVTMQLSRIHLFATTCEGASHAASVADIVLGAFRYCVNQKEPTAASEAMFPLVVRLMWYEKAGDTKYLGDRGLIFRPKIVHVPAYQQEYDNLIEHIRQLLKGVPEPGSQT